MRFLPNDQNWIQLSLVLLALALLTACSPVRALSEEEITDVWAGSAHADAEAPAFSNWNDADPAEIPVACAKCHSTPGYHDFLGLDGSEAGTVDAPAPVGTTVECEACHNDVSRQKQTAVMPSGVELADLGENANCMECHQGRASGVSIAQATVGLDLDDVNRELQFANIHNNPAGPTLYGSEATAGYEYEGRTYVGRYGHVPQFDDCTGCHNSHTLKVERPKCTACHPGARTIAHLQAIRTSKIDYDGDGDNTEGINGEIETMGNRLLISMQLYSNYAGGVEPITYNGDRRPYFFTESGEEYKTWTPRLLRAAYNYHFAMVSRGGYAHNAPYIMQLLYDSLDSFGTTFGMTRP